MSLDKTIGGSASNSYVSVSDADTYFGNHWSTAKASAWAALSSGAKESVLKQACKLLDALRVLDSEFGYGALPPQFVERFTYELTIHRWGSDQKLNFPRNIDVDLNGSPFVPQNVPDAQCEQAVYLLAFDDTPIATRLSGISSETVSAGPVRVHQDFKPGGTSIAPMALDLMREFIRPTKRVQRA
jgi:hypothetical protein